MANPISPKPTADEGVEMSEILRPCPFCGSPAYSYHDNCIDFAGVKCDLGGCVCADILITENNWNTRPVEDALNARIAELEGKIDQLTAHDATERQDDKLPEREVCEACGGDGSILLRDNYKGQATATVDCPYCNCTGYVKECE
jgi:hypothetical protein